MSLLKQHYCRLKQCVRPIYRHQTLHPIMPNQEVLQDYHLLKQIVAPSAKQTPKQGPDA